MTTTIRYKQMLRMVLVLLLMTAGIQGVLADTVVGQVFYEQDYETTGIAADWTTSVNGRFTPTILTESTNHYLGVLNSTRNNNGCVLTNTSLNGKVIAGTDFVMTFDLKVSSSNDQTPTKFEIKDAANTGTIFSLTATDKWATTWYLNGNTSYDLPNTNKAGGAESISDVPWYSVKIKRIGTDTYVTITPKAGGAAIVDNVSVTANASSTGGLGDMIFETKRYNANFAIDNIRVTSLFSFSSNEAAIDITSVGTADKPDVSGQLPTLINEVGASGFSYSSSDWSVARIDNDGHIYLVGVGTTSIGIAGTNSDTYKSNYELTVYGSPATVATSVTPNGETGKTTVSWSLNSSGLVDKSYELGAISMTSAWSTETPISVLDGNVYVLKTIAADGSSQPNVEGGLPETIAGGTYYKFTTSKAGNLTIEGHMGTAVLKKSDKSTDVTPTSSNSDRILIEDLPAGTYYLYSNSLSYIPILHDYTFTYTTPTIEWSSASATVDIMQVGNTNPNTVTGLPTLSLGTANTEKNDDGYVKGYKSSNPSVATFYAYDGTAGRVHICGVGSTTITVIDGSGNTDSYTLTVTGTAVTHTITDGNTLLSFNEKGVLPAGRQTGTLDTGLTVAYGFTDETSIVTEYNDMTVLKVIDGNGYSHPNLTYGVDNKIPRDDATGGTFIKLKATQAGYLIVTGNVEEETTKIYRYGHDGVNIYDVTQHAVFDAEEHTMSVTLEINNGGENDFYYLYNTAPTPDDGTYIPAVHSIRYLPGFFTNSFMSVAVPAGGGNVTVSNFLNGITNPDYVIVDRKGDITSDSPSIVSGNQAGCIISGITKSGVLKITATQHEGTASATFYLTVAYPASAYPGKLWNFNDGSSIHSITAVPTPTTTSGDWTARYKNASRERDARWFYQNAVAGDNAFIVEKTAGLIFETAANSFYMRNDDNNWRHIGFARRGASFTIPLLKAGDIVELNWKRDAETSGGTFTATNVTDLRGKTVSEQFVITGSRNRDTKDLGGWTSFIVASDGDVKFTLEDTGYNDLLSVRIYSGGYRPTMDRINQYDGGNGVPAPTSILLDNAVQSVTLNYSNPLHGTATGPAMYVLKGYRSGVDPEECVKGKDSQKPGNEFIDEDGYPVSSDEKAELYAQRQYLKDFHMYNESWESANNTYNNGVISASGGYGKVTVRLNNYTQDMKYVIGYTPDYTITFGSAPHQTYPYTWNFTNISGGAVHDNSDNAYNNVSKDYDTWANLGNYRFGLYTDTGNGSYYVPGATLVAKDSELNRDEFAGLGFTGGLYFQTADGTADTEPTIDGDGEYSLLEYTLTSSNYQDAAIAEGNNAGYWAAGNGFVKFGSTGKRATSTVAAGGAAYTMDGGSSKYILLKPERPFRNGDIIKFKGYYTAAAASTGSNYGMSFRNEASQSVPYLAAVFIPAGTQNNKEVGEDKLTYTVTRGDGIAGLSEVYVFRASSTTLLTAVSVTTTDHSAGVDYGKRITASSSEPLLITIPDLNAGGNQDYIYIESSAVPSDITNATAAVTADGLDAKSGIYKYKVTAPGNCEVTFAANTTINRIGVTHILKEITKVSSGDAWATESRDRAIDHTLTGVFTVNDHAAKYATVDYDVQKAIVTLKNIGSYGVPASTGLVLKMKMKYNEGDAKDGGGTMTAEEAATSTTNAQTNFEKTKNYDAGRKSGKVPLFAPAISTSTLTAANIAFNGPMGNAMQPNLTERIFTEERENADGTDNDSGTFTRFILATKFMKWKKVGTDDVTHDATFTEGNVPVFYRMRIFTTTIDGAGGGTATELNTLGANKAYLSLHTANLPDALWDGKGTPAKPYIGIYGISDMEDYSEEYENSNYSERKGTYNLSGQRVNDNGMLPPGIYIKNGKKILVK